jgi:hypothetical protein
MFTPQRVCVPWWAQCVQHIRSTIGWGFLPRGLTISSPQIFLRGITLLRYLYLALSMKVHCGQSCIPAGVSDIHGCNHPGVWRLGQTLWARCYECFAVVVSSHISRAVLLHRVIQRASFLCSALSQPLCATAVCRFGC